MIELYDSEEGLDEFGRGIVGGRLKFILDHIRNDFPYAYVVRYTHNKLYHHYPSIFVNSVSEDDGCHHMVIEHGNIDAPIIEIKLIWDGWRWLSVIAFKRLEDAVMARLSL